MAAGCNKILQQQGYVIVPNAASSATINGLANDLDPLFAAASFSKGHFYGYRTKRFGGLLRRSRHMEALVLQDTIFKMAQSVLGSACDTLQLNVAQAIEIHPGEVDQFPHRDEDMWPVEKHGQEYLLNVIWPLVPFTAMNGATRILPFSHRSPTGAEKESQEMVVAECGPGDAICFLGSTLHGAGANRSSDTRRAVVTGYSLGWLKPYENLWLSYPPNVARAFSPALAALAGYSQHRPNLGNFEGQCPSILLGKQAPAFPAAIDALLPEQQATLEQYAQERRTQ
jgi:ectoine hydroxylase-related dioxygenase (phytanoyl-CoA dioxygenase family)